MAQRGANLFFDAIEVWCGDRIHKMSIIPSLGFRTLGRPGGKLGSPVRRPAAAAAGENGSSSGMNPTPLPRTVHDVHQSQVSSQSYWNWYLYITHVGLSVISPYVSCRSLSIINHLFHSLTPFVGHTCSINPNFLIFCTCL